jgi:predicted Zn finger-like uncharacterized protein
VSDVGHCAEVEEISLDELMAEWLMRKAQGRPIAWEDCPHCNYPYAIADADVPGDDNEVSYECVRCTATWMLGEMYA